MTNQNAAYPSDEISVTIGSGAKNVAAGKEVLQQIIYQEQRPLVLPWYRRLTEPFWTTKAWRSYCLELAHYMMQEEGVDHEFSELMALLSPADIPVIWDNKVYTLSAIVEEIALRQVVILGEPGSGKTTSLRHLVMEQAKRAAGSPGKYRIPIFASLGSYAGESPVRFLQDKVVGYGSGELSFLLPSYLSQGRVIVFLDALNEMPGDQYEHNIKLLRQFIGNYPLNRYVFACRTEHYGGELDMPRAIIQPLDDNSVKRFVVGYLESDGEEFYKRLTNENLLDMVRNPFFLWMVLKTRNIPKSKGSLIEHFVSILLEREESKGSVHRQYSWAPTSLLREALEHLAFSMIRDYRTTVISCVEAAKLLTTNLEAFSPYDYLSQGCETLIARYTDDRRRNLSFWHQIIQEYFAASYLEEKIVEISDQDLATYCRDPWWWETLVLLTGVIQSSDALIQRVWGDGQDTQRTMLAAALIYNAGDLNTELEQRILQDLMKHFRQSSGADIELAVNLAKIAGKRFLLALGSNILKYDIQIATTLIELLAQVGGSDAAAVILESYGWVSELDEVIYKALPKLGEFAVEPAIRLIASERGSSVFSPEILALQNEIRLIQMELSELVRDSSNESEFSI